MYCSSLIVGRPQATEQALSLETDVGKQYRLDESLFERLMFSTAPGLEPIPTSRLFLQRRMHPDIADISRATLYPFLKVCGNPNMRHIMQTGSLIDRIIRIMSPRRRIRRCRECFIGCSGSITRTMKTTWTLLPPCPNHARTISRQTWS